MAKSEVHLLLLLHGMWGSPSHMDSAARVIQEVKDSKEQPVGAGAPDLHVLVTVTNTDDHIYDGFDNCGERVAQEVYEEIDKLMAEDRTVTRFSILGYSMGGLIGRYLLGILRTRNFFDKITPVNFTTFATPHVGIPRYPGIRSSIAPTLGPLMLGKSGEQFFHADSWGNTGRSLLEVMADPSQIFFKTLCLFSNIGIYANAVYDSTSPYATSAIELEDPFLEYQQNGLQIKFDPDYPHLVQSWHLPDKPVPPPKAFSIEWFKAQRPSRPLLPPALQFRFPINLLVIVAIPILMPVFVSVVFYHISKSSKLSRARVKNLEGSESYKQRLIHIFSDLENRAENAMMDVAHDVAEIGVNTTVSKDEHRSAMMVNDKFNATDDANGTANAGAPITSQAGDKSLLTEEQQKMVRSLNTIPNMKKYRAFFVEVRNSHAIIISRDARKFEIHEKGLEILKHWAEGFEL